MALVLHIIIDYLCIKKTPQNLHYIIAKATVVAVFNPLRNANIQPNQIITHDWCHFTNNSICTPTHPSTTPLFKPEFKGKCDSAADDIQTSKLEILSLILFL